MVSRTVVVQRVLTDYRSDLIVDLNRSGQREFLVIHGPAQLVNQEGVQAMDDSENSLALRAVVALPGGIIHLRGLLGALRRAKPTSLIVEANPRFVSSLIALAWAKKNGVPALIWGLGVTPASLTWARRVERFIGVEVLRLQLWLSRGAISYGETAADFYTRLSRGRRTVTVAPNATRPPMRPPVAEHQKPDPHHPTRFLFLGRLVRQKNVDGLLRAWSDLPSIGQSLTIAGDGPEKASLQKLAEDLGVGRVSFCGRIDRRSLTSTFADHDWLVMPGSGGLAAKEALAAGVPLIAACDSSGDGTLADVLEHDTNAILYGGREGLESLSQALQRALATSASQWRTMSEHALAASTDTYSTMIDRFHSALDALDEPFPGRRRS